jgi:hypothetical protein
MTSSYSKNITQLQVWRDCDIWKTWLPVVKQKRFSSVNQHDDDAPLEENGDAIIGAGAPKDRIRVAVAAAGDIYDLQWKALAWRAVSGNSLRQTK